MEMRREESRFREGSEWNTNSSTIQHVEIQEIQRHLSLIQVGITAGFFFKIIYIVEWI